MQYTTFRLIIIVCVGQVIAGCLGSRTLDSKKSPDGQKEVAVLELQHFLVDSTISITLREVSSTKTVHVNGQDRIPDIAQIAWSKDSKLFGVLEFDRVAPDLVFAYDVSENRSIDPSVMMNDLRHGLIDRYGLEQQVAEQTSFDPISWVNQQLVAGKISKLH